MLGFEISVSHHAVERKQFRFPRSKKRRIRQKWKRDIKNYREIPLILKMGNQIIAHPSLYNRLIEQIPLTQKEIFPSI